MADPFANDLDRVLLAERFYADADRQVESDDGKPEFAQLMTELREERIRGRKRLARKQSWLGNPDRLVKIVTGRGRTDEDPEWTVG